MARRLAASLALLLLAAGCGDAQKDSPAPKPGVVGTSTTSPATDASSTTANRNSPSTRPRQSSGDGPRPTVAPATDDARLAAIRAAAQAPPGAFAGVLLAPGPAAAITLDVRVGAGSAPDTAVIATIANLLESQSGKRVTVSGPVALRGVSGGTHSANDIRALADDQGTPDRSGVAVVHLLYLAGRFEQDGVLGVSVRGDTLAVFTDQIEGSTSPFVTEARLERAVVTHEMGHLLGLVDIYLNDNRDDPAHPGHSTNRGSVMYWAVETSLVGQVLGGPPPVDFDSSDLADLRKIHGGASPG